MQIIQATERESRLARDDSVSTEAQSVHPIGQPIRASVKRGFKTRPSNEVFSPAHGVRRTWRPRSALVGAFESLHAPSFQSRVVVVAHVTACVGRGTPPAPNFMFGPPFSPSEARMVAQSEQPLSLMRRADFKRRKQSCFNRIAQIS